MLHRTRDLLIRLRSSLISAIRRILPNLAYEWLDKASAMLNGCLLFLKRQEISAYQALAAEMLGKVAVQLRSASATRRNIDPSCLSAHGSWAWYWWSARSRSTQ